MYLPPKHFAPATFLLVFGEVWQHNRDLGTCCPADPRWFKVVPQPRVGGSIPDLAANLIERGKNGNH